MLAFWFWESPGFLAGRYQPRSQSCAPGSTYFHIPIPMCALLHVMSKKLSLSCFLGAILMICATTPKLMVTNVAEISTVEPV